MSPTKYTSIKMLNAEKAAMRKIAEKMDIDIDYVRFFYDSSAATTATTPAAAATTLNNALLSSIRVLFIL